MEQKNLGEARKQVRKLGRVQGTVVSSPRTMAVGTEKRGNGERLVGD